MRAVTTELVSLFSAGTSAVCITTLDEDRAIRIAERAANAMGGRCLRWAVTTGISPGGEHATELLTALHALVAVPGPAVVVLLDAGPHLHADARVRRTLRDALPRLVARGVHLVLVSHDGLLPPELLGDVAPLRLPLPGPDELAHVLDGLCAEPIPSSAARQHAVGLARGLLLGQAQRAFRRALLADAALGPAAVQCIQDEKRRYLFDEVGLEFVERPADLDTLGGLQTFKMWLEERAEAFARTTGNADTPRGVLLVGVQGCGKSLAAKCASAHLGVPLLRLDLPRVLGSTTAGTSAEETLSRALAVVEDMAPVALWLDEVEKTFAVVGAGRSPDARATRVLGAFSTWLQERQAPVFVVATANDASALPPELLRRGRLDETFFVDLPDLTSRKEILGVHLARRGLDPTAFALHDLARASAEFTGAELEQVVVGALHRARASQRELAGADLRRMVQDTVPLATVYEEQIKELRDWARPRARAAGRENALVELFRKTTDTTPLNLV